jgi:two-component SAPR family response regulator
MSAHAELLDISYECFTNDFITKPLNMIQQKINRQLRRFIQVNIKTIRLFRIFLF